MVDVYFSGRSKRKTSKRKLKKMVKEMMLAYKNVPYYQEKSAKAQKNDQKDADETLEQLENIVIE